MCWRLADLLTALGRFAEAEERMQVARSGFEVLLKKHLLAFADHGLEFYAGFYPKRAFELARINLTNRATLRAFEQTYKTAVAANELEESRRVLAAAENRWGGARAFKLSPLAGIHAHKSISEA